MIPTKTDLEIEGTLPGEDVQMKLDENSLSHLMTVLSNLYSNKVLAIVREYSTNALDSHIEAGVTRPIEVNTPTGFTPYFTVRDYGVGMDAETIRNVYSRYGASTKRGTNAQNGMLGLGSKSALTYTTQFTIIGIKNGIKTHVLVSRCADGSGSMKIVGQSNTDEGNGVTIQIPVTDKREIENVAHSFFRYWKPGTVLLNGKDPSALTGLKLGRFIVTDHLGSDHVVMGNVAYPIPNTERIFQSSYSSTGVVAYIDMGEVNFTPSRESLHMTELTKKTLHKLRDEFTAEVKVHLEEKISNAADHSEALKNYHELQKGNLSVYLHSVKYKGESIPQYTSFDWVYHLNSGTTYNAGSTEVRRMFMNKIVIVHGYEYEKVHTAHRQKLKLWLQANNKDSVGMAYFVKEVPLPQWLSGIDQVHWDDIKAHKLTRPSATVSNELFEAIDSRGRRIGSQKVDSSKSIIYSSPITFAADDTRVLVSRFLTGKPDVQLVIVNKNKWNSFKKEFPKAVHIDVAVKDIIDDYLKNMTKEEKLYLGSNWRDRSFCAKLDANKVLDPAIKDAIRSLTAAGLSETTISKYELMQQVALKWDYKGFPNLNWSATRLFEKYFLLDVYGHRSLNTYPIDHVYSYMNNCYKENLVKN